MKVVKWTVKPQCPLVEKQCTHIWKWFCMLGYLKTNFNGMRFFFILKMKTQGICHNNSVIAQKIKTCVAVCKTVSAFRVQITWIKLTFTIRNYGGSKVEDVVCRGKIRIAKYKFI